MRKHLVLVSALVGLATMVNGQKFKTFSDNFESYSNNAWLSSASSDWTTWSGGSGGTDDVRVTTSDAFSGTKSIYFSPGPGSEDVVLPFGGLYNKGQFVYKSMMKIPSSKSAYFNFQGASAVGTTWAIEVTFNTNRTVEFSNQGSGTIFTTNYPQGQWFEIKIYVNLTRNEWHVYIDDVYQGRFSNSINRVSFLDIYPIDNNSSFWVDDVSFIYAPPTPNNAGIEFLTSPTNAVCGTNDLKVRVVNNGANRIDSMRVNWSVDGKLQSPVFVTDTIDTSYSTAGHRLDVTLDSTFHLSKGLHNVKVWTSHPNGKADTLNFDDTLRTTVLAEIRGVGLTRSSLFQGNWGAGTAAWPDTVCVYDTITYGVAPPTGYTNADLGTGWTIKKVKIESNGLSPADTQTIKSSGSANYRLRYVADSSESDSIFKVDISVSVGPGGCDTVLTRYFYVSKLPHVAFDVRDTCLGEVMVFNNRSNGATKNKYFWRYGDNTSDRNLNGYKLYNNAGTYDVTLTATAPSGCRATTGQQVEVHDIPKAKFSVIDACDGSGVLLSDSSTVNSGIIANHLWHFGDGDTSHRQNPSHIYAGVGTYNVRLTVTSSNGCSNKTNGKAVVHPMPDADFSGIDNCALDSVVFTNATSFKGTGGLSYEWDFADGSRSTEENPAHIYGQPGTYSVKMTATTIEGCMDSSQASIEVHDLPVADFMFANTCLGDMTAFTNNSSISNGSITGYSWNLGSGISTAKDAVNQYAATGTYSVQLIITSSEGCMDTIAKDVEIFANPKAQFTVNDVCQNDDVTFTNQSTTNTDTLSHQWNFGDGMTSTMKEPMHAYSTSGDFLVQIIVTDREGCVDSTRNDIEVFELPQVEFTLGNACQDAEVTFDNQSTIGLGALGYKWDFGDGNTSTAKSPKNTYTKDGTFTVQLVANSQKKCSDTLEKTIEIYPLPDAGFTFSHQGFGRYAFTPDVASLQTYDWDFDDGNSSNDVSPVHKYASEGDYDVTLTTTDNNSCSSENTVELSVSTDVSEKDVVSPFTVFPNPFNDEVNITYELPKTGNVSIEVYNLNGKRLTSLVNQKQSMGTYQYKFGAPDASGVYMVRMVIDGYVHHERIVKAQ